MNYETIKKGKKKGVKKVWSLWRKKVGGINKGKRNRNISMYMEKKERCRERMRRKK